MTPLTDIQDSIAAAENRFDNVPFASRHQQIILSILIHRCLTEPICEFNPRHYVHRDIRLAVEAALFRQDLAVFNTSELLSYPGCARLIDLAYRFPRVTIQDARTMDISDKVVLAIWMAAEGRFEAKYPDGKVVRKESQRQLAKRLRELDNEENHEPNQSVWNYPEGRP